MKKDPSNHLHSGSGGDRSLPRSRILRGRNNVQRLFQEGTIILRNRKLNLRFRTYSNPENGCLMGFIVKTTLGKAVRRNRVKRLMREAYRLHQHIIRDIVTGRQITFHGALMANTIDLNFSTVEQNVIELLQEARQTILSTGSAEL